MARGKKFAADQIIPKLREAELVISQGDSTQPAYLSDASIVSKTQLVVRHTIKPQFLALVGSLPRILSTIAILKTSRKITTRVISAMTCFTNLLIFEPHQGQPLLAQKTVEYS
jgi:hypothetical protein